MFLRRGVILGGLFSSLSKSTAVIYSISTKDLLFVVRFARGGLFDALGWYVSFKL